MQCTFSSGPFLPSCGPTLELLQRFEITPTFAPRPQVLTPPISLSIRSLSPPPSPPVLRLHLALDLLVHAVRHLLGLRLPVSFRRLARPHHVPVRLDLPIFLRLRPEPVQALSLLVLQELADVRLGLLC